RWRPGGLARSRAHPRARRASTAAAGAAWTSSTYLISTVSRRSGYDRQPASVNALRSGKFPSERHTPENVPGLGRVPAFREFVCAGRPPPRCLRRAPRAPIDGVAGLGLRWLHVVIWRSE